MNNKPILLKNGLIIDGTGAPSYRGNVLVENGLIKEISREPIDAAGAETVECSDQAVSPGFIDMHSHNDWFMPSSEKFEYFSPFIEQGITTYVTGNCGFGASVFKPGSEHIELLEDNLFKAGHHGLTWRSMDEYFQHIEQKGLHQNIATLTGHGTTRASLRGYDAAPVKPEERKEILSLIEESMEQGSRGVSLGLGYAPDIFTTFEEQKEVAETVKKHNGFITSHVRAFSTISGAYPVKPFGQPHNLKALEEMITLARETGVRMHISHLIFVGKKTWKTLDKALSLIDKAIDEGLDIHFDTYAHHCGATVITGILPEWFMAEVPAAYENKKLLRQAKNLMNLSFALLGFNADDMQLTAANHPDMDQYNGMFVSNIAQDRKEKNFKTYIELAKKSDSTARMLLHKYSNREIILELMRHRASHFMTDAWIEPEGIQNPGAFGCFPRFLQLARESGVISLEETVHKLTGKNAAQAGINDRGILKKGLAADITIFDEKNITDNTTLENSSARPTGIDMVFLNGKKILEKGEAIPGVFAGSVIR